MPERPSRFPMVIGFVLVAVGVAVIFVGWYQAGRQDLETGQLPYIISGGFGGFALVVLGAIAILIDIVRQAEVNLRKSAEELHMRMKDLAEQFVREQQQRRPVVREPREPRIGQVTGDEPAAKPRPRRRRRRRKPANPPQRAE